MKDIKDLAQAEAEKRITEIYPDIVQGDAPNLRPTLKRVCYQRGFIEGAEFGYNQRWIPVSEAMPKEEECHEGQLLAWRKHTNLPELVNHFYFINRSEMYSHWQPINPPKS